MAGDEQGIEATQAPLDAVTRPPVIGPVFDVTTAASNDPLWPQLELADDTVFIGLKSPGAEHGMFRAQRLIAHSEFEAYVGELAAIPGVQVLARDTILPAVAARVSWPAAVEAIRSRPWLDYIEPAQLDFQPFDLAIGCGRVLWFADDGLALPRPEVTPWNFANALIEAAWHRGAQGQGVTVGVLDTGLARAQSELWMPRFASGASAGRTLAYMGCTTQRCIDTLPGAAFDTCNHGTRMAGTIAAPKDGRGVVGVAYRANLHAVVANAGVWAEGGFFARYLGGLRTLRAAGARVIAMAFGGTSYSFMFADALRFEYYRTDIPDVLFVGAAGTNICPFWGPVAFPARLPEVLAVTGVTTTGAVHADACDGPEVDIAAVIDSAPTTGMVDDEVLHFGGSSNATAIVSGVAALVWSRYPSWGRDQLRQRLLQSARILSTEKRYGVVDAFAAVGGLRSVHISGPSRAAPSVRYTLRAIANGEGPFAYQWSTGATSQSIERVGPGSATLRVTDLVDGRVVQVSHSVSPARPGMEEETDPPACARKPNLPQCQP